MRRLSAVLVSLLICGSAIANDPPAKPIKQASAKEEAPDKEESKSSSKSSKASKDKEAKSAEAARAKESLAADELAVKIAERLSILRKEKDDAAKTAPRPVVRSYAPPVKRIEHGEVKPKATAAAEGHAANAAALAGASAHSTIHWSYEGEGGPLSWGKLNPSYAACDNGQRQSPIDIRDGIHVDLDPLTFDYKPSRFSVIDNGHTVQVNMGAGNYINVSGKNYELLQFHFHKPSEERINGKGFEMVVHLVHKGGDGKLAVVAVLIERGKAQALVQSVWNNLPLEKNESVQALSAMDLNQLLPTKRDYYTYMGSLTTPPCSEGVLWLVMKDNIEISPEQLAIFNRLYPMNARPIQKTAGRLIKESN